MNMSNTAIWTDENGTSFSSVPLIAWATKCYGEVAKYM